jgi:hypothetical protein
MDNYRDPDPDPDHDPDRDPDHDPDHDPDPDRDRDRDRLYFCFADLIVGLPSNAKRFNCRGLDVPF